MLLRKWLGRRRGRSVRPGGKGKMWMGNSVEGNEVCR